MTAVLHDADEEAALSYFNSSTPSMRSSHSFRGLPGTPVGSFKTKGLLRPPRCKAPMSQGFAFGAKVSPVPVLTMAGRAHVASDVPFRKRITKRSAWYTIDPRYRMKPMLAWDSLTTLALLYTGFATPLEVSFFPSPETCAKASHDPIFLVNRVLDLIFITDMALQFVLVTQVVHPLKGTRWIEKPRDIALTYLKGWFFIDLCSTLPSIFDFVPLCTSGEDAKGVQRLKAIRVLRCFRLIKLARLVRASRMLKRWETKASIDYGVFRLCRTILYQLLAGHWMACALVLPTSLYDDIQGAKLLSTQEPISEACFRR